jgi:hypothetical protein
MNWSTENALAGRILELEREVQELRDQIDAHDNPYPDITVVLHPRGADTIQARLTRRSVDTMSLHPADWALVQRYGTPHLLRLEPKRGTTARE